jgi:predicted porin
MKTLRGIAYLLLILCTVLPTPALGQSETEEMREEIEALKRQLAALEEKLTAMEAAEAGEEVEMAAEPGDEMGDETEGEEVATAEESTEPTKRLADYLDIYGSLRVRTGIDEDGVVEIDDNVSRIGLTGELESKNERYAAFTQFEVGVRMVTGDTELEFSADPGGGVGQDDDVLTSRLGLAGIRTPFGQFSWGKQNSPYYDVAGFTTDQSFVFGGEASGAYNRGTDGGPSGTGRADRASQYRLNVGPMAFALQLQHRNDPENPNQRKSGDTVGGSLLYHGDSGLSAGVAYIEVRDGFNDPETGGPIDVTPAEGDESTIFGIRLAKERFLIAGNYSIQKQHEVDNEGNLFDGKGVEIFGYYRFGDHIKLEGGWVNLEPDSGQSGDYRIQHGYVGVGYEFGQIRPSYIWAELRIEGSKAVDGSDLRSSILAAGVSFDF